ncbi:hypothetical protein C5N14_30895 [Micromonospora sp. MW-13]|nr:hypothetical protein [Micromonospora sp. MW-13]RGC65001.1 hypothetical protein C5N14_30895 [Micromonospora sp. MW-13]
MTGPFFPDRRTAAGVGVVLLAAGWLCLHDAYVRRNVKPPLALRPFLWWR